MHAEQRPSGVTGSPPPHRDASTRWSTPGRWALLAVVVALARPATHAAPPPPVDPKQQARERAGPHLDRADAECRHALTQDAARDLDSLAVGAALAQAAVRLGVSAGLAGTGAGVSSATLGAGLVVGLLGTTRRGR